MINIAICTQGSIGITVIRKLFELNFKPNEITVITYDKQSLSNKPLIAFLDYFDIKWFVVENDMQKLLEIITEKNIRLLLSISYKYIFKEPLFSLKNTILINLHPGILPYYRGWLSVPWAIYNNESHVGYTYHLINSGIDSGPIILKEKFPISNTSNAFNLHFNMMNRAIDQLDKIISGDWVPVAQVGIGKYYKNLLPNKGYIDTSWDSDKIERFIRAMFFPPYRGAILKTKVGEKEIVRFEQYLLELKNV